VIATTRSASSSARMAVLTPYSPADDLDQAGSVLGLQVRVRSASGDPARCSTCSTPCSMSRTAHVGSGTCELDTAMLEPVRGGANYVTLGAIVPLRCPHNVRSVRGERPAGVGNSPA
jgi:hypothetical protein